MKEEDIITQRMPIWKAISGLVLDKNLSSDTAKKIIETCKESTYSLSQLKKIYAYEIMPSIGTFSDFWTNEASYPSYDEKWLRNIILTYTHNKYIRDLEAQPSLIEKIKSWWFTRPINKDWNKIINKLEDL